MAWHGPSYDSPIPRLGGVGKELRSRVRIMSDPSWLSDSHDAAPARPASKVNQGEPSPTWENEAPQSSGAGEHVDGVTNKSGGDIPGFAKWGQCIMNLGMAAFVISTGVLAIIFSTGTARKRPFVFFD